MSKHNEFLFATDRTRFYFPWMCLLLVFIGSFLCGAGLIAYNSIQSWHQDISKSLTIQVDTYDDKGNYRGENIAIDVEKVLSIVRTMPGTKGASVLDENQMSELMAPWIGADVNLEKLPLPKLIDVEVDLNNPPSLQQLKMDLNTLVPSATIDSHRIWLNDLVKLSHRVIQIICVLLSLLILSIIFTVAYTTKATLTIHESVIKLVHMMGAKDIYIITKYGLYNAKRSFVGGCLGFILAVPLLFILMNCFQMTSEYAFQTTFTLNQWIFLAIWPLLICVISIFTSCKTVHSYLRRFL